MEKEKKVKVNWETYPEETRMEKVLEINLDIGFMPNISDKILEAIRKVCIENGIEEYDQEQGQLCYSAKFGARISKKVRIATEQEERQLIKNMEELKRK